MTCIFVGFWIWKREHSGLCDRWQTPRAAKIQGIWNDSLFLKIAQVIFSPLLILNSRSIWFLQTPYRKSVTDYVTDERQFYIYHLWATAIITGIYYHIIIIEAASLRGESKWKKYRWNVSKNGMTRDFPMQRRLPRNPTWKHFRIK